MLPALGFVLACDDFAAAGCGFPVDVPQVVARPPLAQRFEQPTLAQPAQRRDSLLVASLCPCHRRAQAHRHERRVHGGIPGNRDDPPATAQAERPDRVHRKSAPRLLAAAPHGVHRHRLAHLSVRRHGYGVRRLRAPEHGGTHLTHVQARPALGRVHPAIGHVARAAHRECRRRVAEDAQVRRAGRCRQYGIQPDGRDEQGIGNEHRVERPRETKTQDAQQRDGGAGRQAAPGP